MKSLHLYLLVVILVALLFVPASTQEVQHPFVEDTTPVLELIPIEDDDVTDNTLDEDPVPPPIWSLCGKPSEHLLIPYSPAFPGAYRSDKNGVTIEPAQPLVGENITVTVKGTILKRVTSGKIDVDLRLMKFIKITPTFDLCEQLDGELFQESNLSCPLEEGKVTLIAKKLIPEEVPKVRVNGNITLTNQDGETLTCVYIDVTLQSRDGSNRYWFF